MVREDRIRDELTRGALVTVLEKFSMPFPGYYLYFPQRRHASPALRALVDYLREARGQPSRRKAMPDGSRAAKSARRARGGERR